MKYAEFIDNILSSRGRFGIPSEEYKERHHILPRCLGGTNTEDNLIDLYAEEHFIAHKLLFEENSNNTKLASAWLMMAFSKTKNQQRDYSLSPEEYAELRQKAANIVGKANKGKIRTLEQKEKLKGRKPWNKGLTKETDERVKQCSESLSVSLKKSGKRRGANNSQYGNYGRITGDKNPMKSKEAREKHSLRMKENNPMKSKEIANKVHSKIKGRKWYHDPDTGKRGQFVIGTQPENWLIGVR